MNLSTASHDTLSEEVDRLLEQYLSLLDQYVVLRTHLTEQQISAQQNLARAKFHAPPGVQYGESSYDGRMQAQRTVSCRGTVDPEGGLVTDLDVNVGMSEKGDSGSIEKEIETEIEVEDDTTSAEDENGDTAETINDTKEDTMGNKSEEKQKSKDPLRMFGLLVPETLKKTQADSIQMLEDVIPQLCRVKAAMLELEIKIRRARKYKLRAFEKEMEEMRAANRETDRWLEGLLTES